LDLVKDGVITEANLAYCDVDGFVDDFMAFCLEGEHELLLTSFLGLMRFLGVEVSYKKLVSDAAAYHVKMMLGFCMDLKRGIGYLDIKWKLRFIKQLEDAISADRVSVHELHPQSNGGFKTAKTFWFFWGFFGLFLDFFVKEGSFFGFFLDFFVKEGSFFGLFWTFL
jgi:hypothetical protein